MRPVSTQFRINQPFGSMKTAGVAANSDPASGVGYYVHLYGNYQPFGHAGCDIACPEGTPVHAIAAGTVLWADWGTKLPGDDSNWGYCQRWYLYKGFPGIVTVIQHDGWIGVYAHLSEARMNVGDNVREGQQIGLSGSTGGVAPHLHVEALIDNSYSTGAGLIYGRTDPEPYFGSAAAGPESSTITPAVQKETEVPDYTRISTPATRRRLSAGKTVTLMTDASNKTAQNFAVCGLGHYDVDLFLQGTDLPAGESVTVQFQLIPTGGKPSGYFREEIHGSADGTWHGRARFKMPILKAARLEATITPSKESVYLDQFSAEVYAWKAAK